MLLFELFFFGGIDVVEHFGVGCDDLPHARMGDIVGGVDCDVVGVDRFLGAAFAPGWRF